MEELIGALGIAFVAIAICILWNSRMNAHVRVATQPELEPETNAGDQTATATRFRAMPGLAPAQPAAAEPETTLADLASEAMTEEPETSPVSTPDQPDHEDVDVQLQLAYQLQVIGDFEGAAEYAQMVSSDQRASSRQIERAQSLLRRESVV